MQQQADTCPTQLCPCNWCYFDSQLAWSKGLPKVDRVDKGRDLTKNRATARLHEDFSCKCWRLLREVKIITSECNLIRAWLSLYDWTIKFRCCDHGTHIVKTFTTAQLYLNQALSSKKHLSRLFTSDKNFRHSPCPRLLAHKNGTFRQWPPEHTIRWTHNS